MTTPLEQFVMTVTGPVSCADLGFCHCHEHLFIADGELAKVNPALRVDSFDKSVAELSLFEEAGGSSIVDAQPVGCGRMADYLHRASLVSGVRIIAVTGFHKLIFYPADHWIHSLDERQLADLFISEIEHGMYVGGNSVFPTERISAKAAAIKTASDIEGPVGEYRRLFTAAALAARDTGVPILSHTEMGRGALEQIRLFMDHGVPPEAIIICHLDRRLDDLSYHLRVAETGVYLEYDTIARFKYHSDEEEAEFIAKMVEHGYEDKILLGLDTTRERMRSYGGAPGLDYIATCFIPLLKTFGITDDVISKFMVHNPARAFACRNVTDLKGE